VTKEGSGRSKAGYLLIEAPGRKVGVHPQKTIRMVIGFSPIEISQNPSEVLESRSKTTVKDHLTPFG
jgi:hypothetical protein